MIHDYFAYASFRLPKFAYAFFVSPTENHPSMIMFPFIENTNILSSGVFLVNYLGEKHKKTSRTTTRLRDNQPVTNNTRVRQLVLIKPLDFWINLCFLTKIFIRNTNILSLGVFFLWKYLGEKHKTLRTTARLQTRASYCKSLMVWVLISAWFQ